MIGFITGSRMSGSIKYKLSRRRISNIQSFDVILNMDNMESGKYINIIELRDEDYFIISFSIEVNSLNSNNELDKVFSLAIMSFRDVKLTEWCLKVFKPEKNIKIISLAIWSESIKIMELVKSYGYVENFSADEKKWVLLLFLKQIEEKNDDDIVEWIFATIDFSNISIIFVHLHQISLFGLRLLKDKKIHFSLTDNYVASVIAFKETECDLYTYLLETDEITENRENLAKVIEHEKSHFLIKNP
jgi:hypothetical protein